PAFALASGSISSVLAGTGALTKTTAGTVTLSSGNTYSGATTVSAGTLADGVANALPTGTALSVTGAFDLNGYAQTVASVTGSGTVTDSGAAATFTVNNAGADSFAGELGGASAWAKTAAGTLTLTGSSNTYPGATTISAGTLADGVANALPTGTALSVTGAFDLNGYAQTVASVTGSGTVTDSGAAATFTVNNAGADSFAGELGGASAWAKTAAGTLTLTGSSNTYPGATTISAGTLADGVANALPTGTALSVTGAFDLNGYAQTVASVTGSGTVTDSGAAATFTVNNAGADSFAGELGGASAWAKTAAGTLTLTGSSNTYPGATTISAGTLADGVANALPTGTALSVTGAFDLNGYAQTVASVTGSGTVTDSGAAATFTVNNAGADSFAGELGGASAWAKTAAGTLTLTGSSNTYPGATTISAGTLADGVANALPTGTALSVTGAFDLNGYAQTVASVTGSGTVTDSGAAATFTVNNAGADSFAGELGGASAWAKTAAGTLTLTGSSNTYPGATTISAGTLANGVANALPTGTALSVTGTFDLGGYAQTVASVTGSGTVTDSGAAATFTINNSGADTFAGALTGAMALTKTAAGTLTLTASSSTYSGATTVSGGTLASRVATALPAGTALSVTGTFELDGYAQTVASVTGSGIVTDSGAAATFIVSNGTTDTYAGLLTDNLAFTKAGSGTLIL